jgi:hypothetical protein
MTQIRGARAIADATTQPAPEERIRAIANTVRRPAAFAQAQRAYHDLSERHTALRAEQRDLIQRMLAEGGETANGSGPLIRRIRAVDAELTTCAESLKDALARLFEAREPFAVAIAAALAPERTTAARRALAAAMALADELAVLDIIDREIASVGGQPGQHPMIGYRGAFEQLLARLRRLAVS